MSTGRLPGDRRTRLRGTVLFGTAAAVAGDMSHAVPLTGGTGMTLCGQDYRHWSVIDFTRPFPGQVAGLVCGVCSRIAPKAKRADT